MFYHCLIPTVVYVTVSNFYYGLSPNFTLTEYYACIIVWCNVLYLQTYVSPIDYVMECLNNVMNNNKILNPIASLLFSGTVK